MADLGSIEPELDEEGDIVPPDRGGLPSDSKLLRAVRRLNHPDTTPEQREKYIRWMRKATRARLREMGALVQETPQFAVGEWMASRIGSRAGVPRTVAVCVMVHGTHVVGWETAGPGRRRCGAVHRDRPHQRRALGQGIQHRPCRRRSCASTGAGVTPEQLDQAWRVICEVKMTPVQGHALVELMNFAAACAAAPGTLN